MFESRHRAQLREFRPIRNGQRPCELRPKAIAAARTCYSDRVIAPDEITDRQRDSIGPLTYGAVTWIFAGNHRLGIFVTGIYFVIGLVLLRKIDIGRGRAAALTP